MKKIMIPLIAAALAIPAAFYLMKNRTGQNPQFTYEQIRTVSLKGMTMVKTSAFMITVGKNDNNVLFEGYWSDEEGNRVEVADRPADPAVYEQLIRTLESEQILEKGQVSNKMTVDKDVYMLTLQDDKGEVFDTEVDESCKNEILALLKQLMK